MKEEWSGIVGCRYGAGWTKYMRSRGATVMVFLHDDCLSWSTAKRYCKVPKQVKLALCTRRLCRLK